MKKALFQVKKTKRGAHDMGTIAGALEDLPKALKRVLKARRKFEKAIDRLIPI